MKDEEKIIDDFVSTLSHEIRTPLTSIKGFAQTINDNYDSLDDEQKKKFLQIIQNQAQRLINLVENVLSITKLEAKNSDIVLKEIDLKNIINTTVEIIKMNYKDRIFEISSSKNLPTSLSDYDKLQQILVNIIENACKYSTEKIIINIKNIENKNIIEILDKGSGIDEKSLDKIFDKFYRIGNVLTNKTQGSGLGLYIAKNLAEKIGAEINVQSSVDCNNHFTKFSVLIPIFEHEKIMKQISHKEENDSL